MPANPKQVFCALLERPELLSERLIKLKLRDYQLQPLKAVLDSIRRTLGLEFLLIFPRQSGKNETVAHLLVYLLTAMYRAEVNIVYGATSTQKTLGMERLLDRLETAYPQARLTVRAKPRRLRFGKAAVTFLSTHPTARTRGQTAHPLLVIDEAQDQDPALVEAVFTPMRAANNATALYIGTVKLTTDFLWTKKLQLERQQLDDGIRRVFLVPPEHVITENPRYRAFLQSQIDTHGRNHPIVASEYFLEPIDGSGGLFPERRRRLMRGTHPRLSSPRAALSAPFAETAKLSLAQPPATAGPYIATIDLAGQDEQATDPIAALANPGRDYTVATIFQVVFPPPLSEACSLGAERANCHSQVSWSGGPRYLAVDVFVDHGTQHFQDRPGRPALVHTLLAWLSLWNPAHVITDASGVGQGITSWLQSALGDYCVTGYNFAKPSAKAALGAAFLSLIETGRFKYWAESSSPLCRREERAPASDEATSTHSHAATNHHPPTIHGLSDGAWFFAQVAACGYELPPGGQFQTHLRWAVPPNHKTSTPTGLQPTHDDRLLSAALIAEADRLHRAGKLTLGTGDSQVIPAPDPLGGDVY